MEFGKKWRDPHSCHLTVFPHSPPKGGGGERVGLQGTIKLHVNESYIWPARVPVVWVLIPALLGANWITLEKLIAI